MAGWHHDSANWKEKTCAACGALFKPRSGVNRFCTPACRGKWKYITGDGNTENQYKRISGDWNRYLNRLLRCAGEKRASLTRDDLLRQLEKQEYKCALTGRELTCRLEKGKSFQTNASVDRIVAGGPYTPDNIQLVCRAVNQWRGNIPLSEFVDWCKQVAAYSERS